MIENSVFPDSLKQADIKPVHKKDFRNENENCRPVSILPNLSKIYGRCMCTGMNKSLAPFFVNAGLNLKGGRVHSNVYLL